MFPFFSIVFIKNNPTYEWEMTSLDQFKIIMCKNKEVAALVAALSPGPQQVNYLLSSSLEKVCQF